MIRPQLPNASRRPLEFKLPSFEEDKRLAFVDSVCAALMTSRFGDGAMYTLNPRFEGTADEEFDFMDILEEEPVNWHDTATFLGRTILGRGPKRASSDLLRKPARSKGIACADMTLGRNPIPFESPAKTWDAALRQYLRRSFCVFFANLASFA